MLKLTNNATTANAPSLLQSNQFGKSNVTFTTAAVVQTSAAGLTSTYDLYLNLASDGVVDRAGCMVSEGNQHDGSSSDHERIQGRGSEWKQRHGRDRSRTTCYSGREYHHVEQCHAADWMEPVRRHERDP